MDLKQFIRDIPDFPKEGIMFKDITPLLANKDAFKHAIDALCEQYSDKQIDYVLGAEARGFIMAAAMAYNLGAGFIPARKPGKLPYNTIKAEYELEYGMDALEVHEDAIRAGDRVLVVDDVLATGGTAAAKAKLVKEIGGIVLGPAFLVELTFLDGIKKLEDFDVFSLIKY
ncbi:MAG: adenine phosphoribosyltransferase [Actinobacteria bacterium]|nr:MAG: adenine phosphoribosyltransferase [Actinomycetota bacterium]